MVTGCGPEGAPSAAAIAAAQCGVTSRPREEKVDDGWLDAMRASMQPTAPTEPDAEQEEHPHDGGWVWV